VAGLFFLLEIWHDLRSEIMDDYGITPSVQRRFFAQTDKIIKIHQLLLGC